MNTAASCKRRRSTFTKDVRQMNKAEDVQLQQELDLISRRCRSHLFALSQDMDEVLKDHKRILHLKECELQATVDNTMKELMQSKGADANVPSLMSSTRTLRNRPHTSFYLNHGNKPTSISRSKSAHTAVSSRGARWSPLMSHRGEEQKTTPLSTHRPKSTVSFSEQSTKSRALESNNREFSIMHLKEIATIDRISEKELATEKENLRKEKERLKTILREKLRRKIQEFLQKLDVPETTIGKNVM